MDVNAALKRCSDARASNGGRTQVGNDLHRKRVQLFEDQETKMKIASVVVMAAAALSSAVVAGPTLAQDYSDPHYAAYAYYQHQCEAEKHDRNVAGTIGGAIVGGLLGNAVSRGGGRAGGTVIGAAAGAAVGSNVARSTIHCKDGQPYWVYDQTVDYRAYPGYPGRYADDWYWGHHCRWVQTERGDFIRVCPGKHGYYYPAY
jgi:hypothetical protein